MKLLVLDRDAEGMGIDLAVRAQNADHDVKYWLPTPKSGKPLHYGDGILEKPVEWEPEMDWADLIVCIGNANYGAPLNEYFGKGYPIFGTNSKSAELELDRGVGQQVLEFHDIEIPPYVVVDSAEEGINVIRKEGKPYVLKPWGGDADKAMTCVAKTPNDAIFTLEKWEREGKFKGQLMMQEKIDGVEIGVACFFGPNGWSSVIEESFEHKKFMNDDLGCNTGEQGTVIRHVTESKLFDMVMAPLTEYLHLCKYVGDCSVNCIIDESGTPMPLEFTMRLGYPDYCIRQAVFRGDPIEWMHDLLHGKDTLKVSPQIAVGVVLTHGDFPNHGEPEGTWSGYPITGITPDNEANVHLQQVMRGTAPQLVGGKVKQTDMLLTAGSYVMVVTGTGRTIQSAAKAAYEVAGDIKWPSNIMYRTDIGKKLEEQLPIIQKHGFALGMRY